MASLAVASSVSIAASASSITGTRVSSRSNGAVSVQMAPIRCQAKSEEVSTRRALVAGAAAAALALVSSYGQANAGAPPPTQEEKNEVQLQKGSKEAKKKYANICVSNPTASICHG